MHLSCGRDLGCCSKSSGRSSRDFKHGSSVLTFNFFKDHAGFSVENAFLKFLY